MVSDLIDQNPNRFAVVTYHVNMDGFDVPWGQDRINNFYGLFGAVPSLELDGWLCPMGDYLYCLDQRMDKPTDVTIELSAEQVAGANWRIFAEICIEASGASKPMRIYTTLQLNDYPNPPDYSRYTIMQDGITEDITVNAGSCVQTTSTVNFDSISWADQNNIMVTVWAQTPNSSAPADVFQAAQMAWPFSQASFLSDISITPAAADLIVGEQISFTATGTDQNGQPYVLDNPVWSTTGQCSGTFDPPDGNPTTMFTATGEGACEILCSQDSISGMAHVDITDVAPELTTIEIHPSDFEMLVDQQVLLTATGKDQFGNVMELTSTTWSISGEGSGDFVPPSGSATPYLYATRPGAAVITCTEDGITGTANVTIIGEDPVLAMIDIAPASAELEVGNVLELTATGYDQYGEEITLNAVNWTSSGAGRGSFDPLQGAITNFSAERPGSCTILATQDSVSGSTIVEISGDLPELMTISITPLTIEVALNQRTSLVATGTDQYGDAIDLVSPMWSISGVAEGTFDPPSGSATTMFTATAVGNGLITCSDASVDGTISVDIRESIQPAQRWPRRRFKP